MAKKIEKALKLLKKNILAHNEEEAEQFCDAYDMSVKALELINCLKDRPCEACNFKIDGNCTKWNCIFDELIYIDQIRTDLAHKENKDEE